MKILVVEDEKDMNRIIKKNWKQKGIWWTCAMTETVHMII